MSESKVNRQYKDRLFKYIFGNPDQKEWTLSLFNAVSGLKHKNANDIKLTTIDNFIYMGMKNDISFLVCDIMNFYEHQSTLNPNMPVRFWIYAANVYSGYIEGSDEYDLYSPKLEKLPAPKFICFYNGQVKKEDRCILKLSDCFNGETACELEVTMININWGHDNILDKCRPLEEYSFFVYNVRRFQKKLCNIAAAVERAISIMPDNSLLKGFLLKNKSEVTAMCLTEYDEEKTKASWEKFGQEKGREEGLKEGIEKGLKEGIEKGIEKGLKEGIEKGLKEGEILTLAKLVIEGTLSLEKAVESSGMDIDNFIAKAKKLGYNLK